MNKPNKNRKKKEQVTVRSSAAEYLNYVASVGDDEQQIEIRYEDENIWLTQKLMAMLYGVEVHTVNYHIKKIFADSELQEEAVIRKFRITAVVKENGMRPVICEKGYRNHPLTKKQRKRNRKKSKKRCLVEHVFGFIEGAMHGSFVRTIGIVRAAASFG